MRDPVADLWSAECFVFQYLGLDPDDEQAHAAHDIFRRFAYEAALAFDMWEKGELEARSESRASGLLELTWDERGLGAFERRVGAAPRIVHEGRPGVGKSYVQLAVCMGCLAWASSPLHNGTALPLYRLFAFQGSVVAMLAHAIFGRLATFVDDTERLFRAHGMGWQVDAMRGALADPRYRPATLHGGKLLSQWGGATTGGAAATVKQRAAEDDMQFCRAVVIDEALMLAAGEHKEVEDRVAMLMTCRAPSGSSVTVAR